ncbi:MAG: hypothetical protein M1511_02480, partial [Deltaproteobacteria bacterium]|nr:hypothetical protein [Deltaproteobacteria bacterium]
VEATIDESGNVRLREPVQLSSTQRALVTILEEVPLVTADEILLMSEPSLAEDWNRSEEDIAWSHLQPAQ